MVEPEYNTIGPLVNRSSRCRQSSSPTQDLPLLDDFTQTFFVRGCGYGMRKKNITSVRVWGRG